MPDRELTAEIVRSGEWLYDRQVHSEVWVVKQNFEYWCEPEFSDDPEDVNENGEVFQIVFARDGLKLSLGSAFHSLQEAVEAAERLISDGITWTNQRNQKLFGGPLYSVEPLD